MGKLGICVLLFVGACDSLDPDDERNDQLTCNVPLSDIRSTALDFPYTQGEKQPDLDNPALLTPGQDGKRLAPETQIAGFYLDETPVAIPLSTLHFHISANFSQEGDNPDIAISYSRFTESLRAFNRSNIGDAQLRTGDELFGPSTVLFDRVTENSLWSQFLGQAICGPRAGEYLNTYPILRMQYQEWEALNPETKFVEQSEVQPYSLGYEQLLQIDREQYPSSDDDQVMALISESDKYALDLSQFESGIHVITTVNFENRRVVVFHVPSAGIAHAFYSDREFEISDFRFRDNETQSTWDLMGRATTGPLKGEILDSVPGAFITNKGSWNEFFPDESLP